MVSRIHSSTCTRFPCNLIIDEDFFVNCMGGEQIAIVVYLRDGTGGDGTGADKTPSPCHELVCLSDPMLILI